MSVQLVASFFVGFTPQECLGRTHRANLVQGDFGRTTAEHRGMQMSLPKSRRTYQPFDFPCTARICTLTNVAQRAKISAIHSQFRDDGRRKDEKPDHPNGEDVPERHSPDRAISFFTACRFPTPPKESFQSFPCQSLNQFLQSFRASPKFLDRILQLGSHAKESFGRKNGPGEAQVFRWLPADWPRNITSQVKP